MLLLLLTILWFCPSIGTFYYFIRTAKNYPKPDAAESCRPHENSTGERGAVVGSIG